MKRDYKNCIWCWGSNHLSLPCAEKTLMDVNYCFNHAETLIEKPPRGLFQRCTLKFHFFVENLKYRSSAEGWSTHVITCNQSRKIRYRKHKERKCFLIRLLGVYYLNLQNKTPRHRLRCKKQSEANLHGVISPRRRWSRRVYVRRRPFAITVHLHPSDLRSSYLTLQACF